MPDPNDDVDDRSTGRQPRLPVDRSATVDLGDPRPLSTRQQWRRSAVTIAGDRVYAGTCGGRVLAVAVDPDGTDGPVATRLWTADVGDRVVALAVLGDVLAVGTRGPDGVLCGLTVADGSERWRLRTADAVGEPSRDGVFYEPDVLSLAVDRDRGRLYAGARRYERDDGSSGANGADADGPQEVFESRIYALDPGGSIAWTRDAEASLIALEAAADLVVAAYDRCPGDRRDGVVALDPDGDRRWTWAPPVGGSRLAGDVAIVDGGVAVASHGDHRGYRLDRDGAERFRVDLGTVREVGGQRVFAYPTHVAPVGDRLVFATGPTVPEDGRPVERGHPHEHALACVDGAGEVRWRRGVGGWIGDLASDVGKRASRDGSSDCLAVPVGQHFRTGDPGAHGLWTVDDDGAERHSRTAGVPTAAAIGGASAGGAHGSRLAAIEEPIAYHDGDRQLGEYRLHVVAGPVRPSRSDAAAEDRID